MSKTTIDLSARKGLATRYYGDKPYTSSKPNLRYLDVEGTIAEGICNPLTFHGYLAPANNTTKACSGTTGFLLSSALVVDSRLAVNSTDAIFFADEANDQATDGKVVNLDTAVDTSLDATLTLTGEEPIDTFKITYGGSTIDGIGIGILVNPSVATAVPTIASAVQGESASGSSITKSVTVTGTDKGLYVVAWNRDASSTNQATGATWDGNAMTSVAFGSYQPGGGTKINYNVYRYTNPATTTGDVVVSWAGSENNLGVICIVVNGANQTTPFTGNAFSSKTNASEFAFTLDETGENQLRIVTFLTESTTHTSAVDWDEEVLNDTDTSGRFSVWKYTLGTQFARIEDMIRYQINGASKAFFAKRNTVSDRFNTIGIADLDFSNLDEDWSGAEHSFYLSGASRPVFILGDNNLLYVLDGSSVHSINGGPLGGATGSITEGVLEFLGNPENDTDITRCIDGVDTRGRIWIGLHVYPDFDPRENAVTSLTIPQFVGVYVWDRISGVASIQDFIKIDGVKEFKSMHLLGGNPACFTVSTDGYTQLRLWDGSRFAVAKTMGKNAFPNYRRHSVYEDGDSLMWLGNDGYVYHYARIEGSDEYGLFIIGDMTSHVTSGQTYSGSGVFVAANAVESVTSGNNTDTLAFYLSFKDTAGNHLKKWYPYAFNAVASNNQTAHVGNVYSLVQLLPGLSTLTDLVVRCAPTSSQTNTTIATIKVYANQSTTPFATRTVKDTDAKRGYVRIPLNGERYVNAIQVEIEWATSTLGVDTFLPYTAILEYTETTVKEKTKST